MIFAGIDVELIFVGADIEVKRFFFNDVAALETVDSGVETIVAFAWFSVDNAKTRKEVKHLLCIVNEHTRSEKAPLPYWSGIKKSYTWIGSQTYKPLHYRRS